MKLRLTKLTVVILISILLIVFLTIKFYSFQSKIFVHPNQKVPVSNLTLSDHFFNKTPFNVLLLGYGGGNHDGAYLTDSMIVVHIDPSASLINLISVPRDIWVKIPTNGEKGSYWKINAAYELGLDDQDYPNKQAQFRGRGGGGRMAEYIVSQVTGLPIDRFVALDFNGFKKSIDTLGGVDINVETTFDDYEYPIDGKEDDLCGHPKTDLPQLEQIATVSATQAFPCRYIHLHFDQGSKHMDGERALSYVRSRHSLQDGTDFGRSKRQRNLLVAVEKKVFEIGFIPKALPFMDSLQDDVSTDLSLDEVKTLLDKSSLLRGYKVNNLALSDQNVLTSSISNDGQYILLPDDRQDNWQGVHSWLSTHLNPSLATSSPVIKIENGTHVVGLATLAYNRLQDKDFNLLPPSNSLNQDHQKTSITVFNSQIDPKILAELKKEFNVESVSYKDSADIKYNILITLGNDYNQSQGKKVLNN